MNSQEKSTVETQYHTSQYAFKVNIDIKYMYIALNYLFDNNNYYIAYVKPRLMYK